MHCCVVVSLLLRRKNINCTIDESVERFREVCEAAAERKIPVRAYVIMTVHLLCLTLCAHVQLRIVCPWVSVRRSCFS